MPGNGKYARVYLCIEEDERFRDVVHDARHLGTWLQLLLIAEAMYPAAAPIPTYVSKPSLKVLVGAGLIDLYPHQHYKVHGLASEREMRSQRGRNAAASRWQSEHDASTSTSTSTSTKGSTERLRAIEPQSAAESLP